MSNVIESDLPFEEYDLEDNFRKLKILLYGESGLGKSVLAGSICDVDGIGLTLAQDVEGGMTSLAAFGYTDRDKIRFTKVKSFSKGEGAFTARREHLVSNANKFGATIIDSTSELQAMLLKEVLEEDNKTDADLKVWNKITARMRDEIRTIRDLDIHVVTTALEKQIRDEQTGMMKIVPSLSGKMGNELPAYFDVVGWMTTQVFDGETKRVVYFDPAAPGVITPFLAKDRTGALGKGMIEPTMPKIFKLIREKHNLK